MGVFLATAAYGYQPIMGSTDPFPSALNAGLIGRWEMTNVSSYPGTGVTITNLSTASLYATGSPGIIWSASAADNTNGVTLNGTSTRIDFGISGSYLLSGSVALNAAISESQELTIVYLAALAGNPGLGVGFSGWNDPGNAGNSLYTALMEVNGTGGSLGRSVRTAPVNSGAYYNNGTIAGYFATGSTIKQYGYRIYNFNKAAPPLASGSLQLSKGTNQNIATSTLTGGSFQTGSSGLTDGIHTPWTFGARLQSSPSTFYSTRFWSGSFYAAYMWNRKLSDAEMTDLQTYTNTYVKANS